MIAIRDANPSDIATVGSFLCEDDIRELSLTRDINDIEALARDAMVGDYCKIVTKNDVPVMAFGAKRYWHIDPTLAFVWAFKTDLGWSVARAVTKHIHRTMIPALRTLGIEKAACLVHRSNSVSCRWLTHLGFRPKATPGVGTPHRDLVLYFRNDADA